MKSQAGEYVKQGGVWKERKTMRLFQFVRNSTDIIQIFYRSDDRLG